MGDDITIGVTEIVNNIEVTAQPNDQIVDINVVDNTDEVTLNITPTVVEININKGSSYARWGTIYGTLGDQTDLTNALILKADLVDGKVPAYQLPSFVDDVIEVANYAALPATGEIGKIYITLDDNKIYRWSGSIYIEIASNNAIWGAITGTLSNQLDLQAALDLKANDNAVVHLAGTETITGKKTFDSSAGSSDAIEIISNSTGYGIKLSHPSGGSAIFIDNPVGVGLNINNIGTNSFGISISNPSTGQAINIGNGGAGNGINLSNSHTGNGIYSNNLAAGVGFYSNNASTGQGIHSINNSTGIGILSNNNLSGTGIHSINSSTGTGILSQNSSTGEGIRSDNGSTGYGIVSTNASTGSGIFAGNSASGNGIYSGNLGTGTALSISNSSTGTGIYSINHSSGKNLILNNTTAATGMPFTIQKNGADVFTINDAGEATGVKFIKSGGTSSQFLKADGSIDSTSYALTSQLHDAVTLGTTGILNGLSLSGQVLSLATASPTTRGALTSEDYNYFYAKQNVLTNPITGSTLLSGNTGDGYVPRASGSTTLTNSNIYDNGTNVGIGTTAPFEKFVVSNSGAQGLEITPNFNSTTNRILSYNRSTSAYNALLFDASSYTFSTGNVGIGTPNPGVRFVNSGATLAPTPILGSGTIGANAILSANGLYGLYTGVSNTGDVWQQVQRNDANTSVYNLLLQPSGGNVGIGTTSPSFSLDVHSNQSVYTARFFQPSTSTSAYNAFLFSGNNSPVAAYFTIGGATVGNPSLRDVLGFGTQNAYPFTLVTNDTERMRITSGGVVEVKGGSAGFTASLSVINSTSSPSGTNIGFTAASPNNTTSAFLYCYDSSVGCYTIWSNGTTSGRSDERLKKNIIDSTPKLDKLLQLRIVNYEWKENIGGSKELGLIAQEVEQVFPNLVMTEPIIKEREVILEDGSIEVEKYEDGDYKSVKNSVLPYITIKALQELAEQVKDLKAEIELLKAK